MYEYSILNDTTWPAYATLAAPTMSEFFRRAGLNQRAFAVGASFWGRPAGVIVAELDCCPGPAVIRDFQIEPLYQNTPIGPMLLQQLEALLRERGAVSVAFSYHINALNGLYERALAQAGWPTPVHLQNLYVTHREQETLSWLRNSHLPADFAIVPWADVTAEECAQIKQRQGEGGWYPWDVSPFTMNAIEQIDLPCSVGLRYQGQVVGWFIGERPAPTVAYVTVAFISPELRQRTLGPAMMAELSRRQWAAGVRTMSLEARPGSSMDRFAKRAWAPFLIYQTERHGAAKQLIEA